jgi:LysM repeat protein
MQLLRRFLTLPIILAIVAFFVVLCVAVAFLRPGSTSGNGAAGNSISDRIGNIFSGLRPNAAGPAPLTPVAAAPAAAPAAPAAQPAAPAPAAPAAPAPTPAPTPIPAPTAVVVQPITPVPPVNAKGTVISGNAGASSGSGEVTGSGEAGGVQCGTRVIHTVRAGENLFRIGLRYNTTASAIARLNRITNVRAVSVGRRLVVVACARGGGSSGAYYAARSGTYVVRAGDTLFSIASRFGINVQYLCRVNGLYTSLIVPGQTLVIP